MSSSLPNIRGRRTGHRYVGGPDSQVGGQLPVDRFHLGLELWASAQVLLGVRFVLSHTFKATRGDAEIVVGVLHGSWGSLDVTSCRGDLGGVLAAVERSVVVRNDVLRKAVRGGPVGDCLLGRRLGPFSLLQFAGQPLECALGLFDRGADFEPRLEQFSYVSSVEQAGTVRSLVSEFGSPGVGG